MTTVIAPLFAGDRSRNCAREKCSSELADNFSLPGGSVPRSFVAGPFDDITYESSRVCRT